MLAVTSCQLPLTSYSTVVVGPGWGSRVGGFEKVPQESPNPI